MLKMRWLFFFWSVCNFCFVFFGIIGFMCVQGTSNSVDSVEEPSPDVQVSVSAEEPHGKMDPPKLGPSGEPSCVDTDNNAISPRSYSFIFHYYYVSLNLLHKLALWICLEFVWFELQVYIVVKFCYVFGCNVYVCLMS